VEYATYITEMTAGMDEAAFKDNRTVQLAVMRCLEVMGEAAHHVPREVQNRCPDVNWRLMNDMRNVLIHAYADVNLVVLWDAVTNDVTPTRERLIRFLEESGDAE
jgi:uncharacterized protein with HEPN domain